jgi:uncharacterized protein (TIGR00251 family)
VTSSGDREVAGQAHSRGGTQAQAVTILARGEILLVGVRVIPSASRTEIRGIYGDRLKVAVSAPPEGGKANARLIQALATWLRLRLDDVRVESGHGGRDKMVAFSGVDEEELRERLDRVLPD